jgi:hypothetical protein
VVSSIVEADNYNQNREQILHTVGTSQLIKNLAGAVFLRGGSAQDREQALEWAARFLPSGAGSIVKSEADSQNQPKS